MRTRFHQQSDGDIAIARIRQFPSLFKWTVTWGSAKNRHTLLALTPERSMIPAEGHSQKNILRQEGRSYELTNLQAFKASCRERREGCLARRTKGMRP